MPRGCPRLVALILVLWSVAFVAQAQPIRRAFRIGVLHDGYFPRGDPSFQGLAEGLRTMGLEEGRDLAFEIRFTRGDPRGNPAAAAALVQAAVDVIFTSGEEAAHAAKAATRTIPIVFMKVGDPVAAGLVTSISHPGGNLTGVSGLATELTPKRLEILKALVPGLRRVWAVYHADDRSGAASARKAQEVASALKLDVVARAVRSLDELTDALRGLRPGDGLLAPISTTMNIQSVILDLTLSGRVPAVFDTPFWVEGGALASYGSDYATEAAQAARLVVRILQGARARDLPVEGANRIEAAINLKTARSLGLTVSRDVLARADRVIQ
jgi:putative ABC transport system substrate-binding protein